jgi:1-aminocyclopropane-1-carboxylate deaminase
MIQLPSPLQEIHDPRLTEAGVKLWMKRDDLIHAHLSGNKWRKLKGYLEKASALKAESLISFGGARSNHLAALAYAGKIFGYKTIGYIRGEEWATTTNPTLTFLEENGMTLHYLSRTDFRRIRDTDFLDEVNKTYSNCLIIPDGGYGEDGLVGFKELIEEIKIEYDTIVTPCGTGTTAAGLLHYKPSHVNLIAISALKNYHDHAKEIAQLLSKKELLQDLSIWPNQSNSGFGQQDDISASFQEDWERQQNSTLDPVYTAKALCTLFTAIQAKRFPFGTRLIFLHTGGLQGR